MPFCILSTVFSSVCFFFPNLNKRLSTGFTSVPPYNYSLMIANLIGIRKGEKEILISNVSIMTNHSDVLYMISCLSRELRGFYQCFL
ncbi:hypothetical protein STFR1_30590 [Bacillus vallismortis]